MYKEDSFKHLLFWLKVKRIFFIVFITLVGSVLGGILSSYLVDVLMFYDISKNNIIIFCTIVSFVFANFLTTSISQSIQEGYWKMATLRKLTLISKKLDSLERIEKMLSPEVANEIKEIIKDVNEIKVPVNEDNYSIFDENVQSEISEKNTESVDERIEIDDNSSSADEALEEKNKELAKDAIFEENVHKAVNKSNESDSDNTSSEQINKTDNAKTNMAHISKTMAIISNEYAETVKVAQEKKIIEINENKPEETIIKIEEIETIEDISDTGSEYEQAKIEDIEEIVETIKIENKSSKHTYKRKNIPGSSNAIAMATAYEKNKEEIKFKNNIIEENASNDDEKKQINNEKNENSK